MLKKFRGVVALIPARSGSKGIKNKNIKLINNIPLISYTIISAQKSKKIDKSFVFTDSKKYQNICIKYDIDFPFTRGKKNASAKSTDTDVIDEFLNKYFKFYKLYPEILVYLRPTQPLRTSNLIDRSIVTLQRNKKRFSCLRTTRVFDYPPFWLKKIKNNKLFPFVKEVEKFSKMRRQDLPKIYFCDGYVDVFFVKNFLKEKSFPTKDQYAMLDETTPFIDIDNINDLEDFRKIYNQ